MGFEIWNEKNLKFRQISANKFKALNKSGLLTDNPQEQSPNCGLSLTKDTPHS